MLWIVTRKEIITHVLSLRFVMTFVLALLLTFTGMLLSANEYEYSRNEYGARQRGYKDALDKVLQENDKWRRYDRVYNKQGKSDAVAVSPLSAVAQGLAPALPAAVNVTAQAGVNIDRGAYRNPMIGLFHTPDLGYVVGVVISLLAILFVFDSVSGEKETGTLRLMLSNAVPRHTVLIAKWLGGFVVLVTPFVLVFLAGIGYLWSRGTLSLEGEQPARLAMLLWVALLYISVFFNLGLFVSCCTHRSSTSLFLCLLIWVAGVLALPNLAPVVAKIAAPAPSIGQVEAEKRAIDQEIKLRKERLHSVSVGLSYGKEKLHARERLEQEGLDRKKRWDNYLLEKTRAQTRLAGVLGRVSPTASWVYASTELMQTGTDLHDQLQQAKRRMSDQMGQMKKDFDARRRKSNWQEWPDIRAEALPTLRLSQPDLHRTIDVVLNDVLLLVILNVVFFMLAFLFFVRYDVR
jgi:ABC-type transport system involved in multi-copper enzyme maturation permease subunit